MFSKVGVKVFLGYYWIKTFFWIFCFAKILRTRKKKLKFGQISTKPGQNISRLPFLHHKLHEFSFPCHSLVSSFFLTYRPVPARCAICPSIYKKSANFLQKLPWCFNMRYRTVVHPQIWSNRMDLDWYGNEDRSQPAS